jgi:hypothetical protein
MEIEIQPQELKKNILKKNVQEKMTGKAGEVAHYHKAEDKNFTWDEACLFVEHRINDPIGFKINSVVYRGTVVVPQCTADYLASMEANFNQAEANIYRRHENTKFLGERKG